MNYMLKLLMVLMKGYSPAAGGGNLLLSVVVFFCADYSSLAWV